MAPPKRPIPDEKSSTAKRAKSATGAVRKSSDTAGGSSESAKIRFGILPPDPQTLDKLVSDIHKDIPFCRLINLTAAKLFDDVTVTPKFPYSLTLCTKNRSLAKSL